MDSKPINNRPCPPLRVGSILRLAILMLFAATVTFFSVALPCSATLQSLEKVTSKPGTNDSSKKSTEESAEQIYALAAAFYADQNWNEAIENFRVLIHKYPNDANATNSLFYLGESLIQTNEHKEAQTVFRQFLKKQSGSKYKIRAEFRLAECYYLSQQWDPALIEFRKFIDENSSDPLAEFALPYLGELNLRLGNKQEARTVYEEALRRFPSSGLSDKCRFGLAQTLQQMGQTSEALRFYQFLANQYENELADDAQLQIGKMYAENSEWPQARTQLNKFLRDYPDSDFAAEANYLLAKADMLDGDWSTSWARFEPLVNKLELTSSSPSLRNRIDLDAAIVAVRVGKFQRAKQLIARIRKSTPSKGVLEFASVVEIDIASREKQLNELKGLVGKFQNDYPDSIHLTRCVEPLARLHYDKSQFESAAKHYEILVELVEAKPELPGNLPAWRYLLGLSQIGTGQNKDAIRNLQKLNDFGSDTRFKAATSFAIATAMSGDGQHESAIEFYKTYLQLYPQGEDATRCRADLTIAQVKAEKLDDAINTFKEINAKKHNDSSVLVACEVLAEAALKSDDQASAKRYFAIMSHASDQKIAARGTNGLIWAGDKSKLSAENVSSLIAKGGDADLAVEAVIGQVQKLQSENKHQQAIDILQNILKANGDSQYADEARFRMAVSMQRIGGEHNSRSAETLIEGFLKNNPNHKLKDLARYEFAWAKHDSTNITGARDVFCEIADQDPASEFQVDAAYRAAMLHKQTGNIPESTRRLEQVIELSPEHSLASYSRYSLGEHCCNNNEWATAIVHFQTVIENATEESLRSPARYWLAESLYQNGQIDEAEKQFESIKEDPANEPEIESVIWLRLAQCAARRTDWDRVAKIIRKRRSKAGDTKAGYQLDYLKGRVLMSQARFNEARDRFTVVIRNPKARGTQTAAMSQWMIGESWFHQEQFKEALKAYLLVDSLYDYDQWRSLALLQASKCHVHLKNKKQAIATCQRMLVSFPDSPHAVQAKELLAELGEATPATKQSQPKHLPAKYRERLLDR